MFFLWPSTAESDIHTTRFCAYGQLYVEFAQGNKVWGTTFLDNKGRPQACGDDDTAVKEQTNNKESI